MNPSKELLRARRRRCLAPEVLESRLVMSSGQGSTLAIMPGSVTSAGQVTTLSFEISPTLFTPGKAGKVVLGLDIAPATAAGSTTTTTTFKPQIVSITTPSGHVMRAQHQRYAPTVAKANNLGKSSTSAVLFTLPVPAKGQPAADYTVQVKGLGSTTGQFLAGFYLPGDVAGTGTVTKSDIQTIQSLLGKNASDSKYNFEADVNRDGVINGQDLKIAKENLGASTTVSPVVSVNLDPASDPAANRLSPYSTVHFAGATTPNATITFVDQASGVSTSTTADSSGNYSIIVPLVTGSNTFTVTTLDGFGQSISGSISPVVYSPPASSTLTGSGGTSG
jgi:hypothetical protein